MNKNVSVNRDRMAHRDAMKGVRDTRDRYMMHVMCVIISSMDLMGAGYQLSAIRCV